MAEQHRDGQLAENATEGQQELKCSRNELKCHSMLLNVKVSDTHTIADDGGKSFTSYTIQVAVRFEQFQSLQALPSVSLVTEPDSSASAVDDLYKSSTVRIEAEQFTLEKRYSEFYALHEYLQRHFQKFCRDSSEGLTLPKRILLNPKRNFEQETLNERSQAFENFCSTLLRADEPTRSQLFGNDTVSRFVLEPIRSNARTRLQIGQFGECIADLRMLRTMVRFIYRTEAHILALRILLSLLIAHTYADPRTLPSSTVEQLQAELEAERLGNAAGNSSRGNTLRHSTPDAPVHDSALQKPVDSDASPTRRLLLAAAARYAERAWLVLETGGTQLFGTEPQRAATYRDALACSIEWLAAQCHDPLLRGRIEARYGIHRPDSFPPLANISMLYEAVIRDSMP